MDKAFLLYFIACVTSAPDTCKSDKIALDVADAQHCITVAQPELAHWVEDHPEYRITAYRCGSPPRDPATRL